MLVIDSVRRTGPAEEYLLQELVNHKSKRPDLKFFLVLTKIDLGSGRKHDILMKAEALNSAITFDEIFFVSAITSQQLTELRQTLLSYSVSREWDWPADKKTDKSDVELAEEVIREKIFTLFNQEIPYGVKFQNVAFSHLPNGTIKIEEILRVPKESQKRIMVGTDGATVMQLTQMASYELCQVFGCFVQLSILVKVDKD
eukprot:TRINITY_DN7913_c0_g1_i1.p1 TRINITY_DN7913_c0_g1~~TRINITY_DN7913_c0_g1_i1.p1  ORF type:complete len:200 (+),score=43.58 TRINITY_DN7913_c0_g1_i1:251-850(+)